MIDTFHHPAFPQPPKDNVALWRYMDSDKFIWMLNSGRLFIPSADRLGDPWEGRTPQGNVNWWDQAITNASTPELRATLIHNRDFIEKFATAFRPHYFVTCWHMNEHENYSMWNCYTKSPDAVAMKTTYRQLLLTLPSYANCGLVSYIDYEKERLPLRNLFEFIMHKDKYYSYEQEVRAVFFPTPEDKAMMEHFSEHTYMLEKDPTFRIFAPLVDFSLLIDEIVLSPHGCPSFQARIEALCAERSLPTPVRSRQTQPHAV